MKKQTSFYSSLFMGIILLFPPILAVEGEGAKFEWKKPEEPKDRHAAEVMEKNAIKEQDEAKKELKEAQETGDEEKIKEAEIKAEIKKEEAKYKLKEVIKAEAKFNRRDDKLSEDKANKIIKTAEEDQKKIEKQIGTLSQELAGLVEKPTEPVGPISEKVKQFTEDAQKQFKEGVAGLGTSIYEFFDGQLDIIKTEMVTEDGLPNYKEQYSALAYLRKLGQKESTQQYIEKDLFKKDYQETAKKINERLGEIEKFQKSPPRVLTENELAKKLKLSERIPTDQISAITKELPNITNDSKSLGEALGAMKNYGLEAKEPLLAKMFEERIKALAPEKAPEALAGVKQAEDQTQFFSKTIEDEKNLTEQLTPKEEGGKGTLETISEYASWTVEGFKGGLSYVATKVPEMGREVLATVGEKLAEGGTTAENYGQAMANVPEVVDTAVTAAEFAETNIQKLKPTVKILPGEKARKVAEAMTTVEDISQEVTKNKENLERIGKVTSVVGWVVGGLGEYAKMAGEYLKGFAQDAKGQSETGQLKTVSDFEKASQIIEQERGNILTQEKKSKYAKIFKPIADAAIDLSRWAKNLFEKSQPTIVQASKNYEKVRSNYLETLGFLPGQKPNPEQIKIKLQETLKDTTKKDELKKVTEKLAKASTQLADAFNRTLGKVEGAKANYEWLVVGWDAVGMKKPKTVVDTVNNVVDLRDMRIGYLEAARNGVDVMREDIKAVTQGTDFEELGDLFVDRLSRMVSDEMAKTITEYDLILQGIDNTVKSERKSLEQFIKQQQAPNGPPG